MKKELPLHVSAHSPMNLSFLLPRILTLACGLTFSQVDAAVGSTEGRGTVTHTGRAIYSIPIEVPPTRLGSTPKLSLDYASDAGGGILGKGWTLSGLSEITRAPATIAQDGFTKGVTLTSSDQY